MYLPFPIMLTYIHVRLFDIYVLHDYIIDVRLSCYLRTPASINMEKLAPRPAI